MKHFFRFLIASIIGGLLILTLWMYDPVAAFFSDDSTTLNVEQMYDKNKHLLQKPFTEPATLLVLGSGLIAVAIIGRKKIKK